MTDAMTKPIKIASIQLNSQTDIDANLAIITLAIDDAVKQGARLVVLPENAAVMGRQTQLAERFDEMVAFYGDLAKRHNIHLMAGTLPCPTRPNGETVADKVRQSSILFDNHGKIIARYDKIHLFRATVNDSTGNYDEGKTFEAGDELVVAPCVIDGQTVNVGLMICFDVRFASMAWRLRQMGADILTVPAAFTYQTGKAHWQLLLQARALDSQCMVIGSAQGGTHHIGTQTRQTWGHAQIVNAHGKLIATTGDTEVGQAQYRVVLAELDLAEQQRIRQNMPIFECHRLG